MVGIIATFLNIAMCALNVVIYSAYGNPINLFAAVFAGMCALFCMIMATS